MREVHSAREESEGRTSFPTVAASRDRAKAALTTDTTAGPAEPVRKASAVLLSMRPDERACSPIGRRLLRRATSTQEGRGGGTIPGARRSTPLLEGVVSPQRLRTKSSSKTAVAQCHPASSLFGQPLPLGGSLAQTPWAKMATDLCVVCCVCCVFCDLSRTLRALSACTMKLI